MAHIQFSLSFDEPVPSTLFEASDTYSGPQDEGDQQPFKYVLSSCTSNSIFTCYHSSVPHNDHAQSVEDISYDVTSTYEGVSTTSQVTMLGAGYYEATLLEWVISCSFVTTQI
jgi:hypothetical protein